MRNFFIVNLGGTQNKPLNFKFLVRKYIKEIFSKPKLSKCNSEIVRCYAKKTKGNI